MGKTGYPIPMVKTNRGRNTKNISWTASLKEERLLIGKKKRIVEEGVIIVSHYKWTDGHKDLEACKGGDLNTEGDKHNGNTSCRFPIDTNTTVSPRVKKKGKHTNKAQPGKWRITQNIKALEEKLESLRERQK